MNTPLRERFEADGYLVLKDFWKHGELIELEDQLSELGRRVVGPQFDVRDFSKYQLEPATQSLLYDRLKYLPALSRMSGSAAVDQLCRTLGLAHPGLMLSLIHI